MTLTDAEIHALTQAAWLQLDSLEFDLIMGAYESMETGREMTRGELAAVEKFARLCGLPCAQTLIEAMTEDIEP